MNICKYIYFWAANLTWEKGSLTFFALSYVKLFLLISASQFPFIELFTTLVVSMRSEDNYNKKPPHGLDSSC